MRRGRNRRADEGVEECARMVIEPLDDGCGEKYNDGGEDGLYHDEYGTKKDGEILPPGEAANEWDARHVLWRKRDGELAREEDGN